MKVANGMVMRVVPWAIPVLSIGIFIVDLLTPAGVAVSVLYIIPLLMTVLSSRERDPLYFCMAATMLLWAELFVRPASLLIQYAVLNRALGMLVLWLVAWGLFQLKRTQSELLIVETNRSKALQDLMSERVERSHAEGLMEAAIEARAYAETAVMGAVAGRQRRPIISRKNSGQSRCEF